MSNLEFTTTSTSLTKIFAAGGSFPLAQHQTASKESRSQGNKVSQWIYRLFINFSSSSQRPILTHESDELVLELGVQAGDHHLHGVADLAHALVLGAAHGLHVPLLKGKTSDKNLPTAAFPTHSHLDPLSHIPEMLNINPMRINRSVVFDELSSRLFLEQPGFHRIPQRAQKLTGRLSNFV